MERPDLHAELLRRVREDQEARGDTSDVEAMVRVDAVNLPWVRALVDEVGWPTRSLVGDDGASAAGTSGWSRSRSTSPASPTSTPKPSGSP